MAPDLPSGFISRLFEHIVQVCVFKIWEENKMIKRYYYKEIQKVDEKGILLNDGFFIDFVLCRTNWAKKHSILYEESFCIADRDITSDAPYFLFYMNEDVVIWFGKGFLGSGTRRFQNLRFMMESVGYTTYDLS